MSSRRPRRNGRRNAAVALVAAAAVLFIPFAAPASAAPSAPSEAVTDWIGVALNEIASRNVDPPRAARALAVVSVAMNDAVDGGVPCVHGAAAEALAELFPQDAQSFERRALSLAHSRGMVDRGRRAAAAAIDHARTDGSDTTGPDPALRGPGFWEPTPPAFGPPLEPYAGTWRPWNVDSVAAYRPAEPPRPGAAAFERDLAEVYDVSVHLTDDQLRIALAWADGAGTVTPPGHWNQIAIALVEQHHLSAIAAARVFAQLNTAQADAFIAAWDTKFAYASIRPVTAIRQTIDPSWLPPLSTPPFPSYVSGHATTSGAAGTVLAAAFPAESDELGAMAEEAAISRLYGGIHFRADNEAGLALGRAMGQAALRAAGLAKQPVGG